MMDYYNKYLKYKNKYLNLKNSIQSNNIIGGGKNKKYSTFYVYDKILGYVYKVNSKIIDENKKRYVILSDSEIIHLEKINFKKLVKYFSNNENQLKNKYIHISTQTLSNDDHLDKITKTYNSTFGNKSVYFNPEGLWLSCGCEWVNFVKKK